MTPLYDLVRARSEPDVPYLHVVLLKPVAGVTDDQLNEVIADFEALGERCGGVTAGVISAFMGRNIDPRKGYVLIEVVLFRDRDAFIAWHAHPAHAAFAKRMSTLMDTWVVGDVAVALDVPIMPPR